MVKENWFNSMFMEGSKISSKRVVAIVFSAFAVWAGIYIVKNYEKYALTVFGYTLICIGVLLGVATVAQIVSLVRGTPPPPDETKKDEAPKP